MARTHKKAHSRGEVPPKPKRAANARPYKRREKAESDEEPLPTLQSPQTPGQKPPAPPLVRSPAAQAEVAAKAAAIRAVSPLSKNAAKPLKKQTKLVKVSLILEPLHLPGSPSR